MKTFKYYLLGVGLTLLSISCSDDKEITSIDPDPNNNMIFTEGIHFTATEKSKTITFSTNKDWKITTAETRNGSRWYNVYPTSGKPGKIEVKVEVEENEGYEDRGVALTIEAGDIKKTIMINQKQKNAILLTSNRYEVGQESETILVEVKANISYQVTISSSDENWIKEEKNTRGLTTNTLKFKIEKNEEYEKREGEIIITDTEGNISEYVKIYQSGGGIILLNENEKNISDQAQSIQIDLKSNFDYGIKMPQVDWIKEEITPRGMSSHTVYFAIKGNEDYDARKAEIIFYDKNNTATSDTLRITQAQKNAIIISTKKFELSREENTFKAEVSANVDIIIEIPDTCSWISQKIKTRGLEVQKLEFNVAPNEALAGRKGLILIGNKANNLSDTLIILQKGIGKTIVSFEKDTLWVPTSGGIYNVKIVADVPVSFEKWEVNPEDEIPEYAEVNPDILSDIFVYSEEGEVALKNKNIKNDQILELEIAATSYSKILPTKLTVYGKYRNRPGRLIIMQEPDKSKFPIIEVTAKGEKTINDVLNLMQRAIGYMRTMEGYYSQCWEANDLNWSSYYNHTLTANSYHLEKSYQYCYEAINALKLIEQEGSENDQRIIMPLRNLQAMIYYEMSIIWGNIPYLERIYGWGIGNYPKQLNEKELFTQLTKDLISCTEYLSTEKIKSHTNTSTMIFPSSDVPKALLGRIYLQSEDYQKAKNFFEKIVQSGKYTLTSSRPLFSNSDELIYSHKVNTNNPDIFTQTIEKNEVLQGISYTEILLSLSECEYRLGMSMQAILHLQNVVSAKGLPWQVTKDNYMQTLKETWQNQLKGSGTYYAFLKRNNLTESVLNIKQSFRLLLPLPFMEIVLAPYMTQNPGY